MYLLRIGNLILGVPISHNCCDDRCLKFLVLLGYFKLDRTEIRGPKNLLMLMKAN